MHASPSSARCGSPGRRTAISSPFLIGRDSHGKWVVRDRAGLHGAVFVDRSEALHFAMLEHGRRPQAVPMIPGTLDFNIGEAEKTVREDRQGLLQAKSKSAAEHESHGLVVERSR
jgi:hypothetical protein